MRPTKRSHVNYIVADSGWETEAAFYIDRHASVKSFAKNAGLQFAIPYMHNGEMHDFIPDFIIRRSRTNESEPVNLILETKGYDPLQEVKAAAAERWVQAVNADGRFGQWVFRMAVNVADVSYILNESPKSLAVSPSG